MIGDDGHTHDHGGDKEQIDLSEHFCFGFWIDILGMFADEVDCYVFVG
jgi:hypothetical protein